jgi:hypothetical protein
MSILVLAAGFVLLAAGTASAHWEDPDAIVADLNGPATRSATGVERVERDAQTPRLLIVRVGERWFALPEAVRIEQAGAWLGRWRHSVQQGIVAVLDATTDQPVVHFGPGGEIGLLARPRR